MIGTARDGPKIKKLKRKTHENRLNGYENKSSALYDDNFNFYVGGCSEPE